MALWNGNILTQTIGKMMTMTIGGKGVGTVATVIITAVTGTMTNACIETLGFGAGAMAASIVARTMEPLD